MFRVPKAIAGLAAGAISGMVTGAAILGVSAWLNESSNDIDEKSQWAMVGVFLGARLGLILGALLGLAVGLIMTIRRRL